MMHRKKTWLVWWSSLLAFGMQANTSLLFIDTGNHDELLFHTALDLVKAAGYTPTFKTAFEIYPEELNTYQHIIINLDGAFFGATARDLSTFNRIENAACKHIFQLLDALQKKQNAFIGLILPTTSNPVLVRSISEQLIGKLFAEPAMDPQEQQIVQQFLTHILQSDASKSKQYPTALLTERLQEEMPPKIALPTCPEGRALYLPHNTAVPAALSPLLPLGFVVKNIQKNNSYFITSSSVFGMFDLKEPFILTPFRLVLRKDAFNAFAKTIMQSIKWHEGTSLNVTPPDLLTHPTKKELAQERWAPIENPNYDRLKKEGIVCSWMGIDSYKGKEDQSVNNIVESKTNLMWIDLNPEWYLSNHGSRADKKEEFLKSIYQFTAALKRYQDAHPDKKMPHFFVGTDLTSNFGQYKVTNHAIDIFGYAFDKIPSPLDIEHFWKPEFMEIFDRFLAEWDQTLGNDIPLAGVFFDFEMYHAQHQTGQYHASMDFSDLAWNLFADAQNNQQLKEIKNLNERVSYLLSNKLCARYFNVLKERAKQIGIMIKNHIRKKLPNALIGMYNINPPIHWFYEGILQGMSSAQEPIVCCTFNTVYLPHDRPLRKAGVHLLHAPVLLLSKLRKQEDFQIIPELFEQHDGIWINRFSRLEESRDKKDWGYDWGVETTPLDTDTAVSLISKGVSQAQQ